ncbi:MAG: V-type ATP synthase subunit A [Candidatus Omnitrophica bacterium]|nr:V-type ATP synthase subunit A [Candidatus Omnitrophota bacterium]
MPELAGKIFRINGPVVEIEDISSIRMFDMVKVGEQALIGEVVKLSEGRAFIQVYEDTTSLKAGDPVYTEGVALYVELGPGLLANIYDGIQRPLEEIQKKEGFFIRRGISVPALDRNKKWDFHPLSQQGQQIKEGQIIGEINETLLIKHKIMIPPGINGTLKWIIPEGNYSIDEKIAIVEQNNSETEIFMYQRWPVRKRRPYKEKIPVREPLITGQRVIDTLFPVAKGGCVAVPGPFGAGKTVVQHQLAKWSNAEIVIFIGCGERGNEMTDVLLSFPKLIDPHTKRPLLERTVLIANTSNMPVAAREASIYTGITIAEYYRDMGYNVALMADSTSRWAEALRELSGRLEEMPLEEGFPAYLSARLAEFYERAGKVNTLSGNTGSVSVVASVSPPGGDFSEPVTSHTKRFIRCFWALDKDLAYSRHFPSISWIDSYSEYVDDLKEWWHQNIDHSWFELRGVIMDLLGREQRLLQVVKLVGPDVLPQSQKLILEICSIFKNAFLQQSAFDETDEFSSARKQFLMLKSIIYFYRKCEDIIKKGISIEDVRNLPVYQDIIRMRSRYSEDNLSELENLTNKIDQDIKNWELK